MQNGPPVPTFDGHFESPTSVDVETTRLSVSGWVFCHERPIRELLLQVDQAPPVAVDYGIPRPDIAAARSAPGSLRSGFGVQVPVVLHKRANVTLTLVAVLDDGRRAVCLVRTLRTPRKGLPTVMRQTDSLFRGALMKLGLAIRDRRLPWSPVRWAGLFFQHWREVTNHHSARVRHPEAFNRELLDAVYRRSRLVESESSTHSRSTQTAPISIVAILENERCVPELIRAVEAQPSDSWHLWLVGQGNAATIGAVVRVNARQPDRVTVTEMTALLRPDGSWLPPGETDYCILLEQDAVPADQVLDRVVGILATSDADWIYTDDDIRDASGVRSDPHLKGGVSPELALVDDYMTRLAIVRRRILGGVGGLRSEAGQAQIHDLLLRVLQGSYRIRHLSIIGCHRRRRRPAVLGEDHRRVGEQFLQARCSATLRAVERVSPSGHELHAVVWPEKVGAALEVTVVIPTRDRIGLLARCIDSLNRTVPSSVRLIVIDDHSRESATADYLRLLEQDRSRPCRVLRAPGEDNGFNYARLMNIASREVVTPLMLHLNNDVEAIAPGWLQQMAGWFCVEGVGVVGAKLLDRFGAIDHAGVIVAPDQGMLDHMFAGLAADDPGYQWLPHRLRNASAVTGACLLTRTDDFWRLGGFDDENLRVQFNDVDYCLRVIESGKRVVYEPAAVLYHDVSASRGSTHDYRENAFFMKKYGNYREPFVSRHFDARSISGPTPLVLPSS